MVESRRASTSLMKNCFSVLMPTSNGVVKPGKGAKSGMIGGARTGFPKMSVVGRLLKLKSCEKVESMELPLVRQRPSDGLW